MSKHSRWLSVGILLAIAAPSAAQPDSAVPPAIYYAAFGSLYEGDYARALDGFESAYRGGVSVGGARWVDTICYKTMAGECYYQMGELAKALDSYNDAMKLAIFHGNWMIRVEFPELIDASAAAATARNNITWGRPKRATALARISDRMLSFQGSLDTEGQLRRGGTFTAAELYPINAKEVSRCIALMILRRHEIMGPVCKEDPLTNELIASLARRPTRPNHWSQSWISCQLGLAYAAVGKSQQAMAELNRSLLVAGQYDHELTALGLIGLGRLSFQQGNYQVAGEYFLEASYAAAAFDQADMVQLALQEGFVAHLVSGQKTLYAPLTGAAPWGRRYSRAVQAWVTLLAAENAIVLGDAKQASLYLGQARQAVGTRQLRRGRFGAYFNYQSALLEFSRGNLSAAAGQFTDGMKFLQASSCRLFQIGLADTMYTKGAITPRVADELFEQVLREPAPGDWVIDPMEALAVTLTPHPAPLQRWFEIVMGRKDIPKAIEVSDRLKRHRFYSTLPMGGRLLSVRWLLSAPESKLSPQAAIQRKDLLARYPAYQQLTERGAAIRQQLLAMGVTPDQPDQIKQQTELFEQLQETSTAQELILQEISLRREPSEFLFPPRRTLKEIQAGLVEGQLLLAYVTTDRYVTAFAVSNEQHASWQVELPAEVAKQATELLGMMGLGKGRGTLDAASLVDPSWEAASAELLLRLTDQNDPSMWDQYRELILVPDGFLWYVPFEALHVARDGRSRPLLSRVQIRYVPTMSMAGAAAGNRKPLNRTAVATGQFYAGQDRQILDDAFADLQAVVPDAKQVNERIPAPSGVFASILDRLVVLSDVRRGASAYDWSPMAVDQGKAGSGLDQWLRMPFESPEVVLLPGFHTPAESGLRTGGNGDDVFLGLCGLMASGTETVLLSRWPVAGRSTTNLLREFLQELPFESASAAWQRSVLLTRGSPLESEHEPRMGLAPLRLDARMKHPMFWAGYLLADTGIEPDQ